MIRRAEPADAATLLALWRDAGASPSVTDTLDDVTQALRHPEGSVFVAEIDGAFVGSVIATWDGWRGNLYRLAVLPDYRRQGIASALLREGETDLRRRGARRANVIVLLAEAQATAFWTNAGYLHQREAGRYTRMLDDG